MKRRLAVLAVLGMGCSLFTTSAPKEPEASSSADPAGAPEAKAKPAACPGDLSVDASARIVDSRKQVGMPWAVYKKKKWTPNHGEPVPASFGAEAKAALSEYLAVEAKHPELVPAGFRDRWQAKPQDAALRLEMAACELEQPNTRRRAGYDAAVAILVGGDATRAEEILMESTRNERGSNSVRSCSEPSDCNKPDVCDSEHGECMTPMALGVTYITKDEIDMEHALSRGLASMYRERHGDEYASDDALYWWGERRVHRCVGKPERICGFRAYNKDGATKLVEWDLRDGGSHKVTKVKLSKAERRIYEQKLKCWEATGSHTRASCRALCRPFGRGPECDVECIAKCPY